MFDEEERLVHETRMQSLVDVERKIVLAEEKGREEGLAKGLEKGKKEAFKFMVLNMLEMGADPSTLSFLFCHSDVRRNLKYDRSDKA